MKTSLRTAFFGGAMWVIAGFLWAGGAGMPPSAAAAAPRVSRKAAVAALPEADRRWLEEVAPIIFPDEEALFLELTDAHQRDVFREAFWSRREKPGLRAPLGPGYRDRYRDLREIAASQYDGQASDAGRIVIRYGEPAGVQQFTDCNDVLREVEIWSYPAARAGSSNDLRLLFYRPTFGGPRRLWTPVSSTAEILQPGTCIADLNELCTPASGQANISSDPTCGSSFVRGKRCDGGCAIAQVATDIKSSGRLGEVSLAFRPPEVSLEDLSTLRASFAALATPGAKTIAVEPPSSGSASSTKEAEAGKPELARSAQAPSTAAAPATFSAPVSKKAALAAMPEEERKWMTEFVAPIILPNEEKLFLELTDPHQREIFKQEFWARRERQELPPPLGPGYRQRYEELRQLADSQYDGWRNDAGRMVLRYGEPQAVDKLQGCETTFRDLEIWTYSNLGGRRSAMRFFFYRPSMMTPRKFWTVGTRDSDVFVPGSCIPNFEALGATCTGQGSTCFVCQQACDVYKAYTEIRSRQGSGAGGFSELSQILAPEPISTEGMERVRDRFAGLATPGAKTIGVEGPSGTTGATGTAAAPGAAPAAAGTKAGTATAAASNGPAPTHRKLTSKEVKELTAKLDPKYKQFLDLVELIVTHEEREVFLEIADSYQKDKFIESFWRRRSIDSMGIRTDYQRVYTDRVQLAKEQFKNLNNDRAKIFVLNGPPDGVVGIDCQDIFYPIQIWYYDRMESLKSKVYLIFYQVMGMAEWKLWTPMDGIYALEAGNMGGQIGASSSGRNVDITRCPEYRTIQQAISYTTAVLGSGPLAMIGVSKLMQPPSVETEGVDQVLAMTTELAPNAAPLGLVKLVRFPEARGSKIGVDLSVLVPKTDLKARTLGEEGFYNIDVIGEVVKDERLIDNFKYRFDFPTNEMNMEKVPLTVRRYLYPGEYKLILKVSDGNQSAEGRITEKLVVPEQPDPPTPEELAARVQARAVLEKTKDEGLVSSAISILPIAKEIATGLQRFETKVADGIRAVDFYLNGSKVMTKTRAPFQADLNLGPLPRKQTIRVVAFGESGRSVGEDEYTVNEGRDIFKVKILSPEKGAKAVGPTHVVAAVAVPEGKLLQKIEFYSNETRVATLYQAPFEQTVNIKDAKSLGYVRIVATLDDGTISEDLRYVNAPAYISEVSVDAVELYTAVTEKGRPVSGLQATNFKVFEDGVPQKVESFEYVKNMPLSVGLMIDTSASMLESLPVAEQAAIQFLDYTIGAKDRAFTVSFDNEPYILSKLTNRKDKLYRSMAGMRAEGSTALYDAIVFGLYQFTGVKGKKALVIVTDGKDTASKFDFDTTLEYVRKSGIAIYGIGLKISGVDLDVKYKLNKLANVTGGQTFYIDSANHLDGVYKQINEELRSQYMLTYYSSNQAGAKDQWRKVEVKVEPSHLQAKTISGYYP